MSSKTKDFLKSLLEEDDDDDAPRTRRSRSDDDWDDDEDRAKRKNKGASIEDLTQRYLKEHVFAVGDRVRFKRGLNHVRLPRANQIGIVVEVLDAPVFNSDGESGTPYWKERMDIRVAVKNPETGDFLMYYYDSKRLEPAPEKGVEDVDD